MKKILTCMAPLGVAFLAVVSVVPYLTGSSAPAGDPEFDDPTSSVVDGSASVQFADHIQRGSVTVFDFFADWCGPCRVMEPELRKLAQAEDVVLYKIDISEPNAAAGMQYRIRSIPSVWIFDKDGQLVAERLSGIREIRMTVRGAR